MKYTFFTLALLLSFAVFSQRLMSSNGKIGFYSSAPLEDIKASNTQVLSAYDLESQNVAVSLKIVDFHFPNSLMEEHFNENYMESEKYPKASLTGKITGTTKEQLMQNTESSAVFQGKLNLHGKENELEAPVTFLFRNDSLYVRSVFKIKIADYNIKIPRAVIMNIAEIVDVTAEFSYKLEQK